MPRGIYKRKPRPKRTWRIYANSRITRIEAIITTITNKLNNIRKELNHG